MKAAEKAVQQNREEIEERHTHKNGEPFKQGYTCESSYFPELSGRNGVTETTLISSYKSGMASKVLLENNTGNQISRDPRVRTNIIPHCGMSAADRCPLAPGGLSGSGGSPRACR